MCNRARRTSIPPDNEQLPHHLHLGAGCRRWRIDHPPERPALLAADRIDGDWERAQGRQQRIPLRFSIVGHQQPRTATRHRHDPRRLVRSPPVRRSLGSRSSDIDVQPAWRRQHFQSAGAGRKGEKLVGFSCGSVRATAVDRPAGPQRRREPVKPHRVGTRPIGGIQARPLRWRQSATAGRGRAPAPPRPTRVPHSACAPERRSRSR